MKFSLKRLLCAVFAGCMLFSTCSVAGAIDLEPENAPAAEQVIERAGFRLHAIIGTLCEDEPEIPDPADEIEARTGFRLHATVGTLDYSATENDAEAQTSGLSRATSVPTKEAESYPYTKDWSGTVKFTYTNRYFGLSRYGANFDASASGAFTAEFYSLDGDSLGSIIAEKKGSKYYVAGYLDAEDTDYYYVILRNNSGSAAKNATYSADYRYEA